jgi:hypothetical protein
MSFLWTETTDIVRVAIPQGFSWGIAFFGTVFDTKKNCLKNWHI